jgi:peptide/nickel transport system substrate-binding protein
MNINRDDADSLIRTNPDLKNYRYLDNWVNVVAMRTEKPDLPFKDQRVRRALMMATDFQSIKENLYGGEAEINVWPLLPQKGNEHIYVPLEQLPDSAKELFSYNPEKAKALLAEAGYPNGFKTELIVQNITTDVDKAEIIKSMWAKVGVDVDLQLREGAVFRTMSSTRAHSQMMLRTIPTHFISYMVFSQLRAVSSNNPSFVNDPPGKDPVIEAAYQEAQKNVIFNMPKADQIYHDLVPHIIDQSYYIPTVVPYTYRFWQPWLKNYHGEGILYTSFVWIDEDLKRSLGR